MKLKLNILAKTGLLPIDISVITAIGGFAILIGAVLVVGDRSIPRATDFSWKDRQIGVQNETFTLTFNRPMNWETVADALTIDPPLPGKLSWNSKTLSYTLTDLPVYGTTYRIALEGAKEQPLASDREAKALQPWQMELKTRDRAFAYLGVDGEEKGRLLLYNETQSTKIPLTPPDLAVTNFQPYPDGDRILFSAYDRQSTAATAQQQLYSVTTGLHYQQEGEALSYGRIQRILGGENYQNLQFDLSQERENIVVQRINRENPADSGLWIVPENGNPRPLGIQGKTFKMSPDGRSLAVAGNLGISLVPLTADAEKREFFPGYDRVVAFTTDKRQQIIALKSNRDLTRSLFVLGDRGREREILKTTGAILDCQFEPREEQLLYCLRTEPLNPNSTVERPILSIINIATGTDVPLLALTNDPEVRMSMSPDGRRLLFDQITLDSRNFSTLPQADEDFRTTGNVWSLELPDFISGDRDEQLTPPQRITLGLDPQWIP
ncbi:MAG: Ig-like domain-containing protein [Cyanobacteria bacterium P01_E01_bin.42]